MPIQVLPAAARFHTITIRAGSAANRNAEFVFTIKIIMLLIFMLAVDATQAGNKINFLETKMKSKKIKAGAESPESPLGTNIVQVHALQREQMIATAAYFRAEKRGFSPSDDLADWFESEVEIEKHLNS